jgi:DNA polymerase III epsilon subunit-like protein
MNKIFLDFETYYDRDYSLTKMTTPEYVMHEKFKVLGLSYAINDGPVLWATELPDLDWTNSEVIAHNCYFDAMIMTLRYGIKARRWSCTLSISRALFPYNNSHSLKAMSGYLNIGEKGDGLTLGSSEADQKLIDYAIQDTELCRGIYNKLAHFLPESEQELLHITLRWGVEPTLVGNVEKLEASADLEAAKRDDLILRSGLSEKVLNSNKKFEAWMVEEGLDVPMKTSKTAKITWPVPALSKNDPEFHVCVAQYPELDHVWKGRIAAKSNINILRPRTLASVCRAIPDHKLPIPLKYAGTHTLRWAGFEYNPQNLPNGSVSRTAIEAPKGHVIVVADSSQIELRINAWWSKEKAVLDVLNAGKCIYIQTAAAHFGVPYETFDKTSPARKLGKAISLGCFGGDTQVLTSNGVKPITEVTLTDKVWDGKTWVNHRGLIAQGLKRTIQLLNIDVTPDHLVLVENQWIPAESLVQNENTLSLALDTSRGCLPLQDMLSVNVEESSTYELNVIAGPMNTTSTHITSIKEPQLDVTPVLGSKPITGKKPIKATLILSKMYAQEQASSTESAHALTDAIIHKTDLLTHTEEGASQSINLGELIGETFFCTSKDLKGMINRDYRLIESITIKDTNQIIFDSSQIKRIAGIKEPLKECKSRLINSKKDSGSSENLLETYDLLEAGPNNRFTILTDKGTLIVHNCGYGMGAKKFRMFCASGPLGMDPMILTEREATEAVNTYRTNNKNIANNWKIHEQWIQAMYTGEATRVGPLEIHKGCVVMPGGAMLFYPNLEAIPTVNHWGEVDTSWQYGHNNHIYCSRFQENLVQAMARIVISDQLLEVERRGIRTVSSTHDELIAVCPESEADAVLSTMIEVMSTTPKWADLPDYPKLTLGAEGGYAHNYSK